MTSQNRRPTMKDNQAKYPQLRFKGFTDPWEERKLADVVSISAGGDVDKTKLIEDGGYPVLANALTNSGIVGYYDSYKVEAPAVTVTGRGDVGHAVARHVNFTPVVRLLSLKSEVLDADFLANMLNQTNILVESTGVPQLTAPQLGSYKILYPNLNEQTKIGKLLNAFDNLIALHQRKLDLLKEQKKGYLQKMFPKKGEVVPEIRFPGFTDAWEQRKVGELYKVTRGQVLATSKTTPEKVGKNQYPVYSSQTKNDGLMGYYSDYLFDTAITWTTDGANAGTVNFRPGKFYSTNVNGVLLSADGLANKAMAENLNRSAWKWVSHVGNPKLMNNVMSQISVMIPVNLSEQEKISEFLMMIDNTIALHQRKLDLLKEQKKGFLQNMFV